MKTSQYNNKHIQGDVDHQGGEPSLTVAVVCMMIM